MKALPFSNRSLALAALIVASMTLTATADAQGRGRGAAAGAGGAADTAAGRGRGRAGGGGRGNSDREAPRPIDMGTSLWTEELTWMEVRDRVRAGYRTVIIGTGGVEQNGPYLAGGKHNFVLTTVMPYIAREIGNTLIAPVVKFVPEGGHMAYPGTISVEQSTFVALLSDICRSYRAHGFTDIILIGDSGGNGTGMQRAADTLNKQWIAAGDSARVHHLPEYYDEDRWSYDFLKSQGIVQIDTSSGRPVDARTDRRNGMHTDIYYEAQTAVQSPTLIRAEERRKAGHLSLHGVDMRDMDKIVELGKKLAAYRAGIVAKAFKASQARLRGI